MVFSQSELKSLCRCHHHGIKVGAGESTKQQGGRAQNALLAVANGETAIQF
jgi:hypothetical protein